jgi:hypothetical protein
MSLAVGITLVVAGCTSAGTSETTVAAGTDTIAVATTVVPTTVTTILATTTSGPVPTTEAPPPPSPPTTAAPATTVAPPTTTAAATVYKVLDTSNPAYYPGPVQAGSDLFGSGCSPGSGPLPDGIWFGDLTNVGLNSFDFDLMCFAPNPPGSTEEDGIGDITNSNPTLRTVPVNTSAHVYVLDAAMNWMDMVYQTWSAVPTLGNGCPPGCPLQGWVYVNGGEATEIVMVWTP